MALWDRIEGLLRRRQAIARAVVGVGVVCGVLGIFAHVATTWADKERADDLTRELLGQSRSAAAPGFGLVSISSGPSTAFLSATNVLANGEASVRALVASGHSGKVLSDEELDRAAGVLNDAYGKLADCYRSHGCGKGSQFERLCRQVSAQHDSILRINDAARGLPGVSLDTMRTKNVAYLARSVCQG